MKNVYSLKKILNLNFVLTACLPILCIGLISLYILQDSLQKKISEKNHLIAQSLSSEIGQFLQEPLTALKQIEYIVHQKKLISPNNFNQYLDAVLFNHKEFEMLRVIGSGGKIKYLAPYIEDTFMSDMTGQDFFQLQKQQPDTYWSETYLSMHTGNPTLTLSIPFDEGIIVGDINLGILENIIKKIKLDRLRLDC